MRIFFKQIIVFVAVMQVMGTVAGGIVPAALAANNSSTEVVDRIVAVVNEEVILLSDLEKALAPYEKMIQKKGLPPETAREMRYRAREDVINDLIDSRLTEQKAKDMGIEVGEADVDAAIEHMKKSLMYTDEELRRAIGREGYSMEDYRQQMKKQILQSRLLSLEVKSKTVVTQEEIEAYYHSHPEQYGVREKYHLCNIVMRPPEAMDGNSRRKIYTRMENIHQQLEEGASFAAMARQYSESSFAEDGGDLGLFSLENLSEPIQNAVSQTASGDITPVIETENGYQIFYVKEIVQQPAVSIEDVSQEIREKIYQEKINERFQTWLTELRKKSYIKIIM